VSSSHDFCQTGIGPGSPNSLPEAIITTDDDIRRQTDIRACRAINGRAYAVGMMRQVYKMTARGKWAAIDKGLEDDGDGVTGFESIDGFAEDDLWCVGWGGEIWHGTGRKWRQKDSPTNLILTDVCCAPNGRVYACGRNGMLLAGRGDTWEIIESPKLAHDLWALAWFQDRLYIASGTKLYTLHDGVVADVKFPGKDKPKTFTQLDAAHGWLLTIGSADVFRFDGTTWFRLY